MLPAQVDHKQEIRCCCSAFRPVPRHALPRSSPTSEGRFQKMKAGICSSRSSRDPTVDRPFFISRRGLRAPYVDPYPQPHHAISQTPVAVPEHGAQQEMTPFFLSIVSQLREEKNETVPEKYFATRRQSASKIAPQTSTPPLARKRNSARHYLVTESPRLEHPDWPPPQPRSRRS